MTCRVAGTSERVLESIREQLEAYLTYYPYREVILSILSGFRSNTNMFCVSAKLTLYFEHFFGFCSV